MFKTTGKKLKKWLKVKYLKPGMKIAVPKNRALALHLENSVLTEAGTEKGGGDILWDEIVSIKKLPPEQVYDIEVEGTHNFIGNGIFAHNTYLDGNATTTGSLVVGNPTGGGKGTGTVNAVQYFTNGVDYAEYFYTKDRDLEPGEVVSVDITNPKAVERSKRAADSNVIGIISSRPGIVAGEPGKDNEKVIVGLLGQVPAKASAENGAIRLGDSLTSSSEPGVLMKANAGDSTVGVALESLETGNGMIQVLISRRNKSLTVEEVEEKVQERIAGMEIEDEVNIMVADAMKTLGVDEQLGQLNLRVVELEKAANLPVKEFSEVKVAGELSVLGNINLNGPSSLIVGPVSIAADEQGRIVIKSDSASSTAVVVEGEIKAGNIEVSEAIKTNIIEADLLKASTTEVATGNFEEIVLHANSDANEENNNNNSTATTTSPVAPFLIRKGDGGEVRIKVMETELSEVNLSVTGGAEFAGKVVVKDLEVTGRLVVYENAEFIKDIKVGGDLELSGAITQKFYEHNGETLNFGDAVYVSGDNEVSRAYADDNPYRAVIGIVVGFEEEDRTDKSNENQTNRTNIALRIVKVALGGAVKGFKNLLPGQRYFVSDLMYYINHTDSMATTTDGYAPASLTSVAPVGENLTAQVLAIAKSRSELLIVPMIGYMNDKADMNNLLDGSNLTNLLENTESNIETEPAESVLPTEISPEVTEETGATTEENVNSETAPAENTELDVETTPAEIAPIENPAPSVEVETPLSESIPTVSEAAPTGEISVQ